MSYCLLFLYADWCIVNEGDRVAQLILERIVTPDVVEVQVRAFHIKRLEVIAKTHTRLDLVCRISMKLSGEHAALVRRADTTRCEGVLLLHDCLVTLCTLAYHLDRVQDIRDE